MRRVTTMLYRRLVRGAAARLANRVEAVIGISSSAQLDLWPGAKRVLFVTDDWIASADLVGLDRDQLLRDQSRLSRTAQTIVTVSPLLSDQWRALGHQPVLIPNGCDTEIFGQTDNAPLPDDVDLVPPVAGFIGQLSTRIDLSLLEAIAARGRSLLLVGPRQTTLDSAQLERLLAYPNVCWIGPQAFERLPSYLRLVNVGLTPYADTPFNQTSFPLKTLEYLAAGRSVVATDLPAARSLESDAITLVPSSDPEAFATATDRRLDEVVDSSARAARRAFAMQHSWERRADEFARLLGFA
jgi:teichuronic acid biosynthesis glycosyltransferase TuaH